MMEDRITQFEKGTPEALKPILEDLRKGQRGIKARVRVFYGDQDTGHDWSEENETMGYVGRSTGTKPILLLVHNARSLGGGSLLTHRIVKMINTGTGAVLWEHPKYHHDVFYGAEGSKEPGYAAVVYRQEMASPAPVATLYANCKTLAEANRLADFMNGKRNSK